MHWREAQTRPDVRPCGDAERVLDALAAGVISVAEGGVVARANPGAARILRRAETALVGRPVADVLAPLETLLAAPFEAVTGRHEITVQLGDGAVGTIGFSLVSLPGPQGAPCHVVQFQDIGAVRELRLQRDRLLAMAALGDALPSVLHELRNPLAAITAQLEVLIEESEGALQADLHAVLSEVRRMTLGLDGVGGFVRSAGTSGHAAIDLAVREACRVLEPIAERAGVRIETRGPALPLLPIDRGVMSGVVFNLVKNAIEACRPGGVVTVTAELQGGGAWFALRVADDGVGMAPEVLSRCTELFFTNKDKGSGIGLALCRRVAESSGGLIAIESEAGRGTSVTVRVPVGIQASRETRDT